MGPCGYVDPAQFIQLELFDASHTSLGTVSIAASSLTTSCGSARLSASTVGSGYFDLTPLCVNVKPGDKFTFVLRPVLRGPLTPRCAYSGATGTCTNTGATCTSVVDCVGSYSLSALFCTGACDSLPGNYPGGNAVSGDNTGVFWDISTTQLTFKSFVQ